MVERSPFSSTFTSTFRSQARRGTIAWPTASVHEDFRVWPGDSWIFGSADLNRRSSQRFLGRRPLCGGRCRMWSVCWRGRLSSRGAFARLIRFGGPCQRPWSQLVVTSWWNGEHHHTISYHCLYIYIYRLHNNNLQACGLQLRFNVWGAYDTSFLYMSWISHIERPAGVDRTFNKTPRRRDPEMCWIRSHDLIRKILNPHRRLEEARWWSQACRSMPEKGIQREFGGIDRLQEGPAPPNPLPQQQLGLTMWLVPETGHGWTW